MIKLWRTESLATAASDSAFEAPCKTDNFLVQFLLHRPLAAVPRDGDSTVTLIGLKSGAPQLTINTGTDTQGLWATEDVFVAISDKKALLGSHQRGNLSLELR